MIVNAIEVSALTKVFPGGVRAVDDVTFTVAAGEIFGFLGPNGAGKSTTIMMLTTLVRPTSGTATVAGYDTVRETNEVRRSIGYVSQDLAVDDNLTGWQNLYLQSRFYGLSRADMKQRIDEVLLMVDLVDRAGDLVETYSGGMRKRLDIAGGLIHRPRVLFLDEPTLGLDIQTRSQIWEYIRRLRDEAGMTIFLTTHYMDEADRLCDRIGIIDRGVLKTIDTPDKLKAGLGGDIITIGFADANGVDEVLAAIGQTTGVVSVSRNDLDCRVVVTDGETALPGLFAVAHGKGARIARVAVRRPTLDDVYLSHTGRGLRDETGGGEDSMRRRMVMRRVRG